MRKLWALIILFLFALSFGRCAFAQWTAEELRLEEEEKRKALEETELRILTGEGRLLYDYGGWLTSYFTDFHNADRDNETEDSVDYQYYGDLRFWMKATLKPPLDCPDPTPDTLYVRFKHNYSDRSPSYSDHDGPHVDMAYVTLDYSPYALRLGREYMRVGRGIAYADVHDGIEATASFPKWQLKTTASQTLPHENNIDSSVPGYSLWTERRFYTAEITYLGLLNHSPYAYFVIQDDHSKEHPVDDSSNFRYDSRYLGGGSRGQLIIPNLRYWLEWIGERGDSYLSGTSEEKNISASGFDVGSTYYWPVITHPAFTFEYAFGSGDDDRTNVTNTTNGNTAGEDENFLYFGSFSTGYVLGTRLSNMHIYKLGASLKPLEGKESFKDFTVGANCYFYRKDKAEGGVYDTYATENEKDIGSEIDIFADWRVHSDLIWSVKFGVFDTGEAYPSANNDNEKYFTTSLTLIF